jgi:hypothetical protein
MSRNLLPQMGKRRKISTDFGRNASELVGTMPRRLPAMCSAELNSPEANGRGWPSVVAVSAFHSFVTLLSLDAEGGDGPGFETANADRFVRLFAITVGAVV